MATLASARPVQLDPGRITAGAGAIGLNALLLMLLLVPITAPEILEPSAEEKPYYFVPPAKPVPVPPIKVPVTRPKSQTRPDPRPVERPVVQPPTDTTDHPREGDIVVPPGDPQAIEGPTEIVAPPDDGRPLEGAHLEYAAAPPPPYPRDALRDGLTGTVMLQVLVDVDGKPLEVTVQRSSGHRVLDTAARRQVLSKWRFRPATRNGQPVQAIGIVPVEFKLD